VSGDPVSRIQGVQFTPVRLRVGYDMGSVDDFLDRLEDAASRGLPLGPVVAGAHFPSGKLREGYDVGEVDRFLAEMAGAAAPGTASTDTAYGKSYPIETTPATSVIQEQRGLLSRLFRRKK